MSWLLVMVTEGIHAHGCYVVDYCRPRIRLCRCSSADGSGAIDREELAPLLGQLGIWVSAKMEREAFPRLDLDCSGDIRQEELVAWLKNVSKSLRHILSLPSRKRVYAA